MSYTHLSSNNGPGSMDEGVHRERTCHICHEDTQNYNLNYGGNSCLSCRAFFRRIVQQDTRDKLKCKGKGDRMCEIRLENRKRCKKCRYEACLLAGMKPQLVLDESSFKQRFRKMLKKQKKQEHHGHGVALEMDPSPQALSTSTEEPSMPAANASFSCPASCAATTTVQKVENPVLFTLEITQKDIENFLSAYANRVELPWQKNDTDRGAETVSTDNVVEDPLDLTLTSELPVLEISEDFLDMEYESTKTRFEQLSESVKRQITTSDNVIPSPDDEYFEVVNRVRKIWFQSLEGCKIKSNFCQHLLGLRPGMTNDTKSLTKTIFKSHLQQLTQFYHSFASQIKEFTGLPARDQEILLETNTQLFIQYFLSRYFYAGSGNKQQQWLLLSQVPDFLNDSSYLKFLPFMTFNGIVQLFRDKTSIHLYEEYAKSITAKAIPYNCNCAVAFICLFNTEVGNEQLQAKERIESTRSFILNLMDWTIGKFNCGTKEELQEINSILVKMAKVFDVVDWEDASTQSKTVPMYLSLKTTEEFFQDVSSTLRDIIEKVPFGEDVMQEYVMFNLGVPVSKHFFGNIMRVWEDRFTGIVQFYVPDPDARFAEVVSQNIQRAKSFVHLKHDSLKTGEEQINHSLSSFDVDILNKKFSQIKKVPARIVFKDLSKVVGLSEGTLATYTQCQNVMSTYVDTPPAIYQTLCLITLFSGLPDECFPAPFIQQRRKDYVNDIFTQHKPHVGYTKDFYSEFRQTEPILTKVWEILFGVIKVFNSM